MLPPRLRRGQSWRIEQVGRELLHKQKRVALGDIPCVNKEGCQVVIHRGGAAIVIRNERGQVREIACSIPCQREHADRKKKGPRKISGNA